MPEDGKQRRPGRAPFILEELEDGLGVESPDGISAALASGSGVTPSTIDGGSP